MGIRGTVWAFEAAMELFMVRAGVPAVPVVARRGGSARRRPQPRRDAGHNVEVVAVGVR